MRLNGSVKKNHSAYHCQLIRLVFFFYLCVLSAISQAELKGNGLINSSIADLHYVLEKGDITSVELVEHYLARIDAYDQQHTNLNAIIRLNPKALEQAAALDKERQQQGARGPLHGIPLVLKDNFNTADLATTDGSVAFAGFVPPADAFLVKQLRQAGAIILAKTNMDEFAAGIFGASSLGGQTKNPYDLTRNPGGSSAGTAVAVAAQFAAVGMGTDTCGSITIPSSFNHLVGLRPSTGLTSKTGIIPFHSFTDVGGPIGRSVEDVAIVMDVILGDDPQDPAMVGRPQPAISGFVKHLHQAELGPLRLGKLGKYFDTNANADVNTVIASAMQILEEQGVTLVDIDTALFDTLIEYIPWLPTNFNADIADYLQSYPGSGFASAEGFIDQGLYPEKFDRNKPPIRESIRLKGITKSASHIKAKWQALLHQSIEQVMLANDLDALIFPTVKVIPAKLGANQEGYNCSLGAFSGAPVLALPVGFTDAGLPIGVNLLSPRFSDQQLLSIGYAIEQAIKPTFFVPSLPLTTPPLVNGQVPAPVAFTVTVDGFAEVDFSYDATQSTLQYQTRIKADNNTDSTIHALCLHKAKQGAVIQCLSGIQGRRSSGVMALNYQHIQALKNNEWYLRVFSHRSPKGQIKQRIVFPKTGS